MRLKFIKLVLKLVLLVTVFQLNFVLSQSVEINSTGFSGGSGGLQINSSNKGVLFPRVALLDIYDLNTIIFPATGLIVYNTVLSGIFPNNVVPGFYFFNGVKWERIYDNNVWSLNGNIISDTNFIGTKNNLPFKIVISNFQKAGILSSSNTCFGFRSYNNIFEGIAAKNTFLGVESGYNYSAGIEQTLVSTQAALGGGTSFSANQKTSVGTFPGYLAHSDLSVGINSGGNYTLSTQIGHGSLDLSSSSNSTLFGYNTGLVANSGNDIIVLGAGAGASGSFNMSIGNFLNLYYNNLYVGSNYLLAYPINTSIGYSIPNVVSDNGNVKLGSDTYAQVDIEIVSNSNIGSITGNASTGNVAFGSGAPISQSKLTIIGNDAVKIPVGTTAQRPASPQAGYMRFNTDINKYEGYDGVTWQPFY